MAARKLRTVLVITAVFIFIIHWSFFRSSSLRPLSAVGNTEVAKPGCPTSPLLGDVLVVLRTGATEAREKLPVHFETVLTCIPNYVIYSDFTEDIAGHHLLDVLDGAVDEKLRQSNPDFELYNKLRASGRDGLEYQTSFGSGSGGATDNPGWKLDKWKFMPMVERALSHRPDAKWFVFVEGDTYLVWQNMLEWLSKFDHRQPHYLGKHMYIGDKVTQKWRENKAEIEAYTAQEWAGDMVLGKPDHNGLERVQAGARAVVLPPATFHHMNRVEYEALWAFEQHWLRDHQSGSSFPRFRDMFKAVVLPQLRPRRDSWDNMAAGTQYSTELLADLSDADRNALSLAERQALISFEHCRRACESKPDCIQFSFSQGRCTTSKELRLGHTADSPCLEYSNAASKCLRPAAYRENSLGSSPDFIQAGWMMDRIANYVERLDNSCGHIEKEWLV
ncbi:hypothetical protein PG999_003170 [Apiospora kogelbergensis]|uniref:N-acetylgalactosaminide beta-1,3-galactosyltransferase n=1 Tax=Apiospora kogelbergensis TaxID=1337665 RepID=A0AAW0RAJ6_9PEZI